jgi:hypothetical protein
MENLLPRVSNIKAFLIAVLLIVSGSTTYAQKFLVPDGATIQYGGSIGYLNLSMDYDLWKDKGLLDFGFGFVPRSHGGDLEIISAKFSYRPIRIKLGSAATFYPLNPGAFITYHLGKDFDFERPKSQFDKGYYWWSTSVRPHLSLSNEVKLNTEKAAPGALIKGLGVYSEFNTNDLYLVSWFQNRKTVPFGSMFKLGFGLRAHF